MSTLLSRPHRFRTIAEIDETRAAATERAFAWLEETVRACFHRRGCNCAEIMAILADAGRTDDCPECRGTGWLTLFRNSDGSGDSWPEVCEPGCGFNHGHFDRECESCLSGKVIAGEGA